MAFGMFSSHPFGAFERGYCYDDFPFYRPHSAGQFGVSPLNSPFFWDTPTQMEDEDERPEYPERQNNSHRKAKGKKANSRKFFRPCSKVHGSLHEDNDEQSTKDIDSKKRNVQIIRSPRMSDLCDLDEEEVEQHQQTKNNEEMTRKEKESIKQHDEFGPNPKKEGMEQDETEETKTVDMDVVNKKNEKFEQEEQNHLPLPEVQSPKVQIAEVKIPDEKRQEKSNDEHPTAEMDANVTENSEQNTKEKENKRENMEDAVNKKLELIELQLKKARELAPKEVLSEPKTDKQRLYLTEMLLRCILDLDMIETEGNETVKQSRREAVREIQSSLDQVEYSS